MAVSTQHRFSVELANMIIDQAERQDLRACALTCRAWYQRSRYHIFRRVSIDDGHRCEGLGALLRAPPVLGFPPLLDLIEAVYMEGHLDKGADNWGWNGSFADLHPVFAFVHSFRLCRRHWNARPLSTPGLFHQAFPNLRRLTVSASYFGSVAEIAEILSDLSRLEHLELDGVRGFVEAVEDDRGNLDWYWNSIGLAVEKDVIPSSVRTLVLHKISSHVLILMFLRYIRGLKELQSVQLRYLNVEASWTAQMTVQLLRALPTALESLGLCIPPESYDPLLDDYVHKPIDLSLYTRIKSLTLFTGDDLSVGVGLCINHTLRSVNSSELSRITLVLGDGKNMGNDMLDWETTDDIIAQLPSLERFSVRIDAESIDTDVVQSILRRIPKLQARGIANIEEFKHI